MKVAFELPASLLQRLRSHIPSGGRSRFVADLISKKLRNKGRALAQAAHKANTLRKVNHDMKDWEALNGFLKLGLPPLRARLGKAPQRRLSLVQHFKRLKGLELPPYLDE
jgi:hypothetical protein